MKPNKGNSWEKELGGFLIQFKRQKGIMRLRVWTWVPDEWVYLWSDEGDSAEQAARAFRLETKSGAPAVAVEGPTIDLMAVLDEKHREFNRRRREGGI